MWTFLLAAVEFPILGIDFLRHYRLLVDPAAGTIFLNSAGSSGASLLHSPTWRHRLGLPFCL
jgi:hypothetical protein